MWKFFNNECPKYNQVVDIIWSDGTEDISRWVTDDGINWLAEITPVCWRENSWENA